MSHLTVCNAGRRGGATGGVKGGWDLSPKWMEETRDGVGGVAAVEFHRYASLASNQRMSEKLGDTFTHLMMPCVSSTFLMLLKKSLHYIGSKS